MLPTIFPTDTLKLPILTRETHDVSSGSEVAIPNNKAPAKLAPKLSLAAIISVTYVINILDITNPMLTKINLIIICFNESDVVTAVSSLNSSAVPLSSLDIVFTPNVYNTNIIIEVIEIVTTSKLTIFNIFKATATYIASVTHAV